MYVACAHVARDLGDMIVLRGGTAYPAANDLAAVYGYAVETGYVGPIARFHGTVSGLAEWEVGEVTLPCNVLADRLSPGVPHPVPVVYALVCDLAAWWAKDGGPGLDDWATDERFVRAGVSLGVCGGPRAIKVLADAAHLMAGYGVVDPPWYLRDVPGFLARLAADGG